MINNFDSTFSVCLHCGKKKINIVQYNYAGFFYEVKLIDFYHFPDRMTIPSIPGPQESVFICDKCASSRYKVHCKAHGTLKDSYEYGSPPRCFNCEADLKKIKHGELPQSFEAIVPISSQLKGNRDTWFGLSKYDEICFIQDKSILSEKKEDFIYSVEFIDVIDGYINLVATSKRSIITKKIGLFSKDQLKMGTGPWIKPWLKKIQKSLGIDSKHPVYLSFIEYHTVQKNNTIHKVDKSNLTFWTISNNRIRILGINLDIPSCDCLASWSLIRSSNRHELKSKFYVNNIPSILKIVQPLSVKGINSIGNINFPDLKKIHPDKIQFGTKIGIFRFDLNLLGAQEVLIEKKPSNILLTVLPTGEKIEYNYGYCYKNNILLINSINNQFAVSCSPSGKLHNLCSSLLEPDSLFNSNSTGKSFSVCFGKEPNSDNIKHLNLYNLGFEINSNKRIQYTNIQNFEYQKCEGGCELSVKYKINSGDSKQFIIVGPEKYIHDIWKQLEMKKVEKVATALTTNDLYKKYNELKKQNLLVGLLSDVILLNKELEREIPIEELMEKLERTENRKFYENKRLYNQTVSKLVIFYKLLPKIKQNYEVLNSFYPHYQLKNELDFIAKAFSADVADKIEPTEREKVIGTSRHNIGMLQNKFQRVFSEIERSLSPLDSIFTKEEIQKDFMAKASKYAAHGGQVVLIGTLVAAGGAVGGVGILAGMLGIRAMSDILGSLRMDFETAIRIKSAAEKSFSWWKVFKTTLPVTIFEASKMIEKENNRCQKRDHDLFQYTEKENAISIDQINKTLKITIAEATQIRFNEVLTGSGIRFNDIAAGIDKVIKIEMPTDMKYNSNIEISQDTSHGG